MISLTADDTCLLKELQLFVEPVEVYDTSGKLLGLFVPANLERGKQLQAQARALFDADEFKRRLTNGKPGTSLREFWGWVRAFDQERERRKTASEPDFTTEEAVAFVRALREQHQQSPPSVVGQHVAQEAQVCPSR